MERFSGSWKMESHEGDFAAAAVHSGMPEGLMNRAMQNKTTLNEMRIIFGKNKDKYTMGLSLNSKREGFVVETEFKLEEPVITENALEDEIEVTYDCKEGVMTENVFCPSSDTRSTLTAVIKDGKMIRTTTYKDKKHVGIWIKD